MARLVFIGEELGEEEITRKKFINLKAALEPQLQGINDNSFIYVSKNGLENKMILIIVGMLIIMFILYMEQQQLLNEIKLLKVNI